MLCNKWEDRRRRTGPILLFFLIATSFVLTSLMEIHGYGKPFADEARYLGGLHEEKRYTIGVRIYGKLPRTRFDYDFEAASQVGTYGDADIFANMVSLDFGWRPCFPCLDPRIASTVTAAT